jgi:fumarate reductase subunit C
VIPAAQYTPYHPRWYRRRVSVWWWLKQRNYALFVLRELTSVCVAYVAVALLLEVVAIGRGPEAHALFRQAMGKPAAVVVNALALGGLLFHSVTWFLLAPKAMDARLKGQRVPDAAVSGANFAAWAALSGAVAWLLLRG